jgi:hypothetical protein
MTPLALVNDRRFVSSPPVKLSNMNFLKMEPQ